MSEDNFDWVSDLIDTFDADFEPQTNRKMNLESLTDGDYTCQVMSMELDRIQSTGSAILRWILKVVEGPSCQGCTIEKVNFFSSQPGVNALGADLQLLGIDCKGWKAAGIPLSRGLIDAMPRLKGVVFVGRKKASSNQNTGKVYHNLNVLSVKHAATPADEESPF